MISRISIALCVMAVMAPFSTEHACAQRPAKTLPCFPGAYYRKAVSSMGQWQGIEGILTVPSVTFDPSRRDPSTSKVLDNPSIYMGGKADGQEIDAGLTWEHIKDSDGSVSKERKAFRPFWRNEKWNSAPAQPEYYYYPGDTVKMRCAVDSPGKLKLDIILVSRAGTTTDVAVADPISTFSTVFGAKSFGPGKTQQFKRVNAIDQVNNEGKTVKPTNTEVRDAIWREVWLLRPAERLPMTPDRFTDMRCPSPTKIEVLPDGTPGMGGERITLSPGATAKK